MGIALFLFEVLLAVGVFTAMIAGVATLSGKLSAEQPWLMTGALLAGVGTVALLASGDSDNYAPAVCFAMVSAASGYLAFTLRTVRPIPVEARHRAR